MARGFFNRILDAVGLEEDEYEGEEMMDEDEGFYGDEVQEQEDQRPSRRSKQPKVIGMPNSAAKMRMLVFQPCSYEEAEAIIDNLKARKPVIMNLDDLDRELAQRIIDFIGGAVYSLGGDLKKVARSIFVVAPSNVDVMQSVDERTSREGFRRFD